MHPSIISFFSFLHRYQDGVSTPHSDALLCRSFGVPAGSVNYAFALGGSCCESVFVVTPLAWFFSWSGYASELLDLSWNIIIVDLFANCATFLSTQIQLFHKITESTSRYVHRRSSEVSDVLVVAS